MTYQVAYFDENDQVIRVQHQVKARDEYEAVVLSRIDTQLAADEGCGLAKSTLAQAKFATAVFELAL